MAEARRASLLTSGAAHPLSAKPTGLAVLAALISSAVAL
jgi:hypothetical protein